MISADLAFALLQLFHSVALLVLAYSHYRHVSDEKRHKTVEDY